MPTSSSNTFVVRDARPEEVDQVSQVIKAAYSQYSKNLPPEAWGAYSRDIVDVRSRLPQSELIVAVRDGAVLGTVTLYAEGARSEGEGWPEGWAGLRLLATHPGYRGQGIADALMQEAIRRSRERHTKHLGLHTSQMMAVAKQMYEKMGFVRVQAFDFRPRPDVVIMAYRLDI